MKVLFISGCYASESIELLRSYCRGKVGIQNASNSFQWSVIKGLCENNADFNVISYPLLPIFPARYKRPFSPKYDIIINDKVVGQMCPYCTVIGLKSLSIRMRLYHALRNILIHYPNDRVVLLLSSTNSFFIKAVLPLKKQFQNLTVAAIITDLIDDAFNYKSNNTFLKRIQIKNEIRIQKGAYKYIDKFILLTKVMEEKIPEAIGKSLIVEGICDRTIGDELLEKPITGNKIILYTGTLQKYVGVDDFVDAFMLTNNPNYRFVICGAGPSEPYILECARNDDRVIYKGVVTRDEALELQKKASVVVNPRKPTESITRYSFPSKTIEYLSSGTPMIGYQLEGIPKEYYNFFYSPKDLTKESMCSLIDEVLQKSVEELDAKANAAKMFIKEKKNSKTQIRKILDFFDS